MSTIVYFVGLICISYAIAVHEWTLGLAIFGVGTILYSIALVVKDPPS